MSEKTGIGQKAIVVNGEGKILTLRRSDTAPVRPLTWDLPGGDLDFGEDPYEGIVREIKEEAGLMIDQAILFDVASRINKDGEFWVTIGYTAYSESVDVELSYEHDQFQWVTPEAFLELESSPVLMRFIQRFIEIEHGEKNS